MPTFDGDNLLMVLDAPTDGVLTQDVKVDWYKAWKQWQLSSPINRGYPAAFLENFGGNDVTDSIDAGAYFIFQNQSGWRMRPHEESHTINFIGNFIAADASLPLTTPTLGAYTVLINGLQPVTTIATVGSGVLPSDVTDIRNEIFNFVMENSETFAETIRIVRAEAAGSIVKGAGTEHTIKSADGNTDRIVANADASGRTVTSTDGS